MADIRYNLSELFQLAFGQNSPVYITESFNPRQNGKVVFTGVKVKPEKEAQRMSWLGTPILFPVKFKKGTYNTFTSNGELKQIRLSDFYLPPATLVDFKRAKNVTKTNVLGDTGTVKEIFGFDDWKIRIKGLCLNEPNSTAYQQIQELLQWEQISDNISVSGQLFTDKEINSIVIESIEIPQVQGKPNVIPFTINAVSDQILELTIE